MCKECFSARVQENKRRRLKRSYKYVDRDPTMSYERDGCKLWVELEPDNNWHHTYVGKPKPALWFEDEQERVKLRIATFRNEQAAKAFFGYLECLWPELKEGLIRGLEWEALSETT